uniref:glycogenin glucosyltransferase n=1 Tax=Meloidogyne javanica TaxID=6303 RepID=A0A915M9T6_MELJA
MTSDNTAWVTLATNDGYAVGALVLAHSLRNVGTTHKLHVLYTSGVSFNLRNKLEEVFDNSTEVNVLDSGDEANLALIGRPDLGVTFTKLHCWRLTQYNKCVFLDADTFVVKNCDELFDRPEFSAAPDIGWPDIFNTGVFVYVPSLETYNNLLQFAVTHGSFDGGDQGLLNAYFSGWREWDASHRLPFTYNVTTSAIFAYAAAVKRFAPQVKIVHFLGKQKPWLVHYESGEGLTYLSDYHREWRDLYSRMVQGHLPDTSEVSQIKPDFPHSLSDVMTFSSRLPELTTTVRKETSRLEAWEAGTPDYLEYAEKLLSDFESCFRMNVEYQLWKNCFYSPIEVLRKRSEDGGPHTGLFKGSLNELIEPAITFYEGLLKDYEVKFSVDFSKFYQPYASSLSLDKFDECAVIDSELPVVDSMVLRSAQRLIICFADLYRYKALSTHKEARTYSFAKRSLYWQAHFLEPLNGHPFNQLAVIACYEKKWVDVLFYYIRALSVLLPFKSARESLELALNKCITCHNQAITYEKWVFELIEIENRNIQAATNNYESGPYSEILNKENKFHNVCREIWFHPSNDVLAEESLKKHQPVRSTIEGTLTRLFVGDNGNNVVQKKAICHLLHCAGVLISTIGLDQFKQSYDLIINELLALVDNDDTVLTPAYLLKIIILYTFPIHSPKPDMDKVGLFILTGQLSEKFSCIIPSICFLVFWLYRIDKFLIGNRLNLLRQRRTLCDLRVFSEVEDPNKDFLQIQLPEFMLLTPYFDILSKSSVEFFIDVNSLDVEITDKDHKWIAVQARFALILRLCEYLSEGEYFPIKFDVRNITDGPFRLLPHHKVEGNHKLLTNEMLDEKLVGTNSESGSNVCDTNTLIDYPDEIKFFVSLKISVLLVPTIVIDELSSLVKGMPINKPTLLPREILNPEGSHSAFVMSQASKAIDWLREAAENKDRGLSAKALSQQVPVRTFPNFLKWACPDAEKSVKNI